MTKKAILVAAIGIVLAACAPSFAQGPFADVPIDHWAYDAVSQLQDQGIIIGYPDGTFGGKRAMTRYEFALALSRAIPIICDLCQPGSTTTTTGPAGIGEDRVKALIDERLKGIDSSGVDALKRSVDEFRDELSGLGVDLDALKRDVASLEERVAAIEEAMRRLKITTKLNFFAIAEDTSDGVVIDRDNRELAPDSSLLRDIGMVRDADIILNYDAGDTRAKVAINAGDYFGYLAGPELGGGLTSFSGEPRFTGGSLQLGDFDLVTLFLAYGEFNLLGADVSVGRFPIQFTKWTLKKFDVDSYTENWKTDDGNYYVDGIKGAWNWGSVDILAFAGKNSYHGDFYNLVSRPMPWGMGSDYNTSAGNLTDAEQSAGIRAAFGLGSARVGVNYMAVGEGEDGDAYNDADIYGADLEIPFGSAKISGAWTRSDSSGAAVADLDEDNTAWEARAELTAFGRLDLNVGYKSIEPNFSAPGDWLRIGRLQNPTNIQGPEVGLKLPVGSRLALRAYGAWFEGMDDSFIGTDGSVNGFGPFDSDFGVDHYKAGVNLMLGSTGSIDLEGEWVKWDPTGTDAEPAETYYTISYNRMLSDSSKLRLLYQIIDFDGDGIEDEMLADYKGAVAVAQVSMDF